MTIAPMAIEEHPELGKPIRGLLEKQRKAFASDGTPSAKIRIDRLERAMSMVKDHQQEFVDALNTDFGHRSPHLSRLADIATSFTALKYARGHVRRWMKPERRKVDFPFKLFGVKAWVQYQPLGVVGLISPWNYPITLTMLPLADVLAAGNRAMLKPSELTPASSELLASLVKETFDEAEVSVVTGGADVGAAFCTMPFDHIIFTGSTRVGRIVMHAAAENLVPVTLELGGKSPVVIGRKVDMDRAVGRIALAKTTNAGQICISPDYTLVPADQVDSFVESFKTQIAKMFPKLLDNQDYTSIVNKQHYERLQGYLADAKEKGAQLVEINPSDEDFSDQSAHKMPPTLVLEPTDEMTLMKEEIFGPIMPVKAYKRIEDAIGYVNRRPRPLALYYFGTDKTERDLVLDETTAGGVTVNDALMHFTISDLPFGGVGPSGIGSYRGIHGFKAFSHAKAVCKVPSFNFPNPVIPPYGDKIESLINFMIK